LSFLKTDLVTKYLDAPTITSLDISPGNTCNFKCRICGPKASSLFAQEVQSNTDIISVKSLNWPDSSPKVLEEIIGLLPSLTNIDMYGGEPFLIKHLYRLVQEAVDQDQAKHIRLHYNSNGSIYPAGLIEHWKKFKHIDIQFSIDNVRERFELERGGSWSEVEANICRLVDLKLPNLKISIMPTVNVMNILYLDEVLQWADSLGLPVNFNYLSTPAEFSIKNLTAQAKKIIIEKLKNHPRSEVINMLATIQSLPDSDGKDFVNLSKHFDRIRNQNLLTTHRDIATAMGMM
jgi:sulfatase maturation enzyme AslB (radical SAM superfamily)